jgi:transposase InsO family protein
MQNNYKYSRAEVNAGIPTSAKYANVIKKGNKYYKKINNTYMQIVFAEDITEFMRLYYDDPKNTGAYLGRDKIFAAIKTKYIGISRRDIARFLSNFETSQLHTVAPVVKVSRPMTPKNPLVRWACDLTFITNAEDVELFILFTCIDTFSKYAWARIVPDKTAASSAAAIKSIFDDERPNLPSTMIMDGGTEFHGEFAELLKKNNVKKLVTQSYSPQQNAFVERFNRTIKSMLNRYLTSCNGITISHAALQQLVNNYNSAQHSTTKLTPLQVHPGKSHNNSVTNEENTTFARAQIKNRVETLLANNKTNFPEIVVGDYIRVHKRTDSAWRKKTSHVKKYSYQKQYSTDIFRVVHISKPQPTKHEWYELVSARGHKIQHKFLRQDLLLIDKPALIREVPEGIYVIEKVIGKKIIDGKLRYQVRWRGWDTLTYELPQDSYAEAIAEYNKSQKK